MTTSLEESKKFRVNPVLATFAFMAAVAVASACVWMWLVQLKAGAQEAPGPGTVIRMGMTELAALDEVWDEDYGFIVWSSTMYGPHELIRMDWPSGRISRLTKNPFVDSTPKISPEGTRVVFARSRQEWVSFRNLEEWDIWMLDLTTGKEHLIAERGAGPSWSGDGQSVVFQRGGREVVQASVEPAAEAILLGSRDKTVWTTPSMDPKGGHVAVTVRGKKRRTALFSVPGGTETPVAGGCQLAYAPDGNWMVVVEKGGKMKNRICRVDREGKNLHTLIDMPGYWSHEYFPRVSNDGKLLVFGAAREGHEHDTADYEIFLWRIGDPWEYAARVTFHTGNDQWPDIWVIPKP